MLGPLFIVSGPSGSGKSTLVARLLAEKTWPLRLSVSVTTRAPRAREVEGIHYHFWPRERFLAGIQDNRFLEWADVFGNYYGTLAEEVGPYRDQGQGVLLDIDVQGWEQVRKKCPDAVSIFICVSSEETLKARLLARGSDSLQSVQRRVQEAQRELTRAGDYDFRVNNDGSLDQAYQELRTIVHSVFERNHHAG